MRRACFVVARRCPPLLFHYWYSRESTSTKCYYFDEKIPTTSWGRIYNLQTHYFPFLGYSSSVIFFETAASTALYAFANKEATFISPIVKGASPSLLRIALSILGVERFTVKDSIASPACQNVSRCSSRDMRFSSSAEAVSAPAEVSSTGNVAARLSLSTAMICSFVRPRNLKIRNGSSSKRSANR